MERDKVLLVDLGSVVIKHDWGKLGGLLLGYYNGPRGFLTNTEPLTAAKFIEPLRRSHRYIDEFDLGHITPFGFYCLVTDLLRIDRRDLSYPTFRKIYGEDVMSLHEPMVEFLEQHGNVKKIIASNINDISWAGLQKKFGKRLNSLFTDAVLSYVIHERKPNIPFWLECSRIANQRLETMVLVDDREINTASFEAVGGKAVQYDLHDHRNGEQKLLQALYLPHERENKISEPKPFGESKNAPDKK